jgi:DNA-binding MarR family transcriptional regulator
MKEDHETGMKSIPGNSSLYTEKQGQYLAFIYYYSKINRIPPAEADMQKFFGVSAPSVHRMLVDLERKQLIERKSRQARSICVLLPPQQLPDLL